MPRLTSLCLIGFVGLPFWCFLTMNATADLTEQEKTEIKALIGEFISRTRADP